MQRIVETVIKVSCGRSGYDVRVLCHTSSQVLPAWDDTYESLSWLEAQDLVADQLASRRPGWMLDEGRVWSQPSLYE